MNSPLCTPASYSLYRDGGIPEEGLPPPCRDESDAESTETNAAAAAAETKPLAKVETKALTLEEEGRRHIEAYRKAFGGGPVVIESRNHLFNEVARSVGFEPDAKRGETWQKLKTDDLYTHLSPADRRIVDRAVDGIYRVGGEHPKLTVLPIVFGRMDRTGTSRMTAAFSVDEVENGQPTKRRDIVDMDGRHYPVIGHEGDSRKFGGEAQFGRTQSRLADFFSNNLLPRDGYHLVMPNEGQMTTGADGKVDLYIGDARVASGMEGMRDALRLDTVSMLVGGAAALGGLVATAPATVLGVAVAGGLSAGYALSVGAAEMVEAANHGEDMNPFTNPRIGRMAAGMATSIAALNYAKVAGNAAKALKVGATTAEVAAVFSAPLRSNVFNVATIAGSGGHIAFAGKDLYERWDGMSPGQRVMTAATLVPSVVAVGLSGQAMRGPIAAMYQKPMQVTESELTAVSHSVPPAPSTTAASGGVPAGAAAAEAAAASSPGAGAVPAGPPPLPTAMVAAEQGGAALAAPVIHAAPTPAKVDTELAKKVLKANGAGVVASAGVASLGAGLAKWDWMGNPNFTVAGAYALRSVVGLGRGAATTLIHKRIDKVAALENPGLHLDKLEHTLSGPGASLLGIEKGARSNFKEAIGALRAEYAKTGGRDAAVEAGALKTLRGVNAGTYFHPTTTAGKLNEAMTWTTMVATNGFSAYELAHRDFETEVPTDYAQAIFLAGNVVAMYRTGAQRYGLMTGVRPEQMGANSMAFRQSLNVAHGAWASAAIPTVAFELVNPESSPAMRAAKVGSFALFGLGGGAGLLAGTTGMLPMVAPYAIGVGLPTYCGLAAATGKPWTSRRAEDERLDDRRMMGLSMRKISTADAPPTTSSAAQTSSQTPAPTTAVTPSPIPSGPTFGAPTLTSDSGAADASLGSRRVDMLDAGVPATPPSDQTAGGDSASRNAATIDRDAATTPQRIEPAKPPVIPANRPDNTAAEATPAARPTPPVRSGPQPYVRLNARLTPSLLSRLADANRNTLLSESERANGSMADLDALAMKRLFEYNPGLDKQRTVQQIFVGP